QAFNDVDDEEVPFFTYITRPVAGLGVNQRNDLQFMACCDCTDGCQNPLKCACIKMSSEKETSLEESAHNLKRGRGRGIGRGRGRGMWLKRSMRNSSNFSPFNREGKLIDDRVAIYECNPRQVCACNPRLCQNRVAQLGVSLRLQVFRCKQKDMGWGLRCLDPVPAGTFVLCYLGELLTEDEAEERGKIRGDEYLYNLD
ncbi:unnamed protein product, partial [Choristocarpus tenellus]